ncbi:MAG: hypothetical protein R3F62_26965 [Planctomycetota bacterium]
MANPLPESEACRILHVSPAGLAQLVRAGHLSATLEGGAYRLAPQQVHALQPRAVALVASLEQEVARARQARQAQQLALLQDVALKGALASGALVALIACAAAPLVALPLLCIAAGVVALGLPGRA